MSNHYVALLEKIERQNAYSMKDKLEAKYQLTDAVKSLQSGIGSNQKYLKIIVALQLATLGASNSASLAALLKLIL